MMIYLPPTLPEAARQCQILGRERYDELLKTNPFYIVSRFSNESLSDWAMAYAHRPEGEGLTEPLWLSRYGKERFALLQVLCNWLDGKLDLYRQLRGCPKCGTLYEEGDSVSLGGGKIVITGAEWECGGGWVREGCDSCDFEHHSDTH